MEQAEVAVIGAGVVGLCIAHRLASEGREVLVIDPEPPGSGTSWGNAGTIADYAVQPVGTPAVLRALPSLLFDRNSPLAIRRAALPALAPWLARFLRQSLPARAEANARVLAALLADASALWAGLAADIGAGDLMQDRGCLYWYQTDAGLAAAKADMAFRRSLGVTVELLSAAELQALEPGLPVQGGGGAFFPGARFLTDPGRVMTLIAKAAAQAGARFVRAPVEGLAVDGATVTLTGPAVHVNARHAVIAAGAQSRRFARMAGDRVPLDTERGYHLEWDMARAPLTRPTCPTARGFYLCPMSGRLRVAGTVELGGLTAPPSPHRLQRLEEGARAIFPDLGAPSRGWMGFRPSIPDSLPVIGPGRAGPAVLHAYGHGHIGLTLAPATARRISAILAGGGMDGLSAALSPHRF